MRIRKTALALALCWALGTGALQAAGEPTELSADVLEYDTATGEMQATGSVRMTQGSAVVTGAQARYNARTEAGVVTGGVSLRKEDLDMRAAQVELSGGTLLIATGDVVAKKGDRVLTGPRVEYDTEKEYALVPENARATMPDGIMTADRLEAFLADNHFIAQGSVHIVSETKRLDATGDRADYYGEEKGKVILSGNAVAVQDNNTLRGKTLTLYLGGDQARVR